MRLFVSAMNIHRGGGRVLLTALLASLPDELETVALLDHRMPLPPNLPGGLSVRSIAPSISARLSAERWLARHVGVDDRVLCFGNLPPLFRLRGTVTTFIQNRYLIDKSPLKGFTAWSWLRVQAERIWLTMAASHTHAFIVQTPSMKTALSRCRFAAGISVHVRPFIAGQTTFSRSIAPRRDALVPPPEALFLYVSTGEPHKNHRRLVEAWRLLADEGLFPALHLTVSDYAEPLCRWIDAQTRLHGLNIVNHGQLPPEQLGPLYASATALIYPSLTESFGLPLIEARRAGLPILASEMDYVRDLIDPEESFDPASPVSIMRSVKRFLGLDQPNLSIMDGRAFIDALLSQT